MPHVAALLCCALAATCTPCRRVAAQAYSPSGSTPFTAIDPGSPTTTVSAPGGATDPPPPAPRPPAAASTAAAPPPPPPQEGSLEGQEGTNEGAQPLEDRSSGHPHVPLGAVIGGAAAAAALVLMAVIVACVMRRRAQRLSQRLPIKAGRPSEPRSADMHAPHSAAAPPPAAPALAPARRPVSAPLKASSHENVLFDSPSRDEIQLAIPRALSHDMARYREPSSSRGGDNSASFRQHYTLERTCESGSGSYGGGNGPAAPRGRPPAAPWDSNHIGSAGAVSTTTSSPEYASQNAASAARCSPYATSFTARTWSTGGPDYVHTTATRTGAAADGAEQLLAAVTQMAHSQPGVPFARDFWLTTDIVFGGQSLVVFARSKDSTMRPYAIKFFTTLEDYYTEIGFYGQPAFRSCLPRLVQAADNADARVQAPDGFVFPPFVVLDRGMTLGQWLATPRVPSAVVAMATEVLKLLGQLHAGGNVHRDVKPQNLLLTMHSQEWRLLDFGIVARVGERRAVSCTLPYAPPEAVNAHFGAREIKVSPALDIWAIGVIVYESLTGTQTFGNSASLAALQLCSTGEELYPWERELAAQPEPWRRARCRGVFEACLSREPAKRPSALGLLRHLHRMDHMTTHRVSQDTSYMSGASPVAAH